MTDKGTLLRGAFVSSDMSPTIPSKEEIAKIKSYGLNTIHLYAECASEQSFPGERQAQVDSIISWAEEEGLYVIMTIGGCTNNGSFDVDFVRGFWEFYAPRYKDKTHVVYEIMNEPAWRAPYKEDNIAMQRMAYEVIRKHAPETHVQLLSYCIPAYADSAMIDIKKLSDLVDWRNASIATHGYAITTDNFRNFIKQIQQAGYAITATEPQSIGDQFFNATTTRVFEEEFVSYTHFIPVSNVLNKPERYSAIVEQKDIRWEPDFGTWPEDVPVDYRISTKDLIYAGFYDIGKDITNTGAKLSIKFISSDDYIAFNNLEFAGIPTSFAATCAPRGTAGEIEVRLDAVDGPLISTCRVLPTASPNSFQTFSSEITNLATTGVHDVYLVFKVAKGDLMEFESFQFKY